MYFQDEIQKKKKTMQPENNFYPTQYITVSLAPILMT